MKICNLYCGVGGNRKYWDKEHTGEEHDITAVENNEQIAKIYQDFFPKDKVIVADAHQYLLEHFKEFEFIWSSPPCPTHSQVNHFLHAQGVIRYPDMSLWQEIIFLKYFCKVKYCVENVKSYYEPMFNPQAIARHYFWANFVIAKYEGKSLPIGRFGPTKKGRTDEKDKLKRNCVEPELGLHILNESKRNIQAELFTK